MAGVLIFNEIIVMPCLGFNLYTKAALTFDEGQLVSSLSDDDITVEDDK